ncbi:MAG: site-2 protease family protein [Balneolaceae bacterium]
MSHEPSEESVDAPRHEWRIPPENPDPSQPSATGKNRITWKDLLKHGSLFLITFLTVTATGILWVGQTANAESFMDMVPEGALFAIVFLLFLGTHEMGHYVAAVRHRVAVSLPWFIPVPFGIGTLGAVIKIKERVSDSIKLFDIGIAGPIAGFIVALIVLLYGLFTLPDPSFIASFDHHDEIVAHVEQYGSWPDNPPTLTGLENGEEGGSMSMILGNTLLYSFLSSFFPDAPPMYELYHYPFLFAGWLGLFFTALNLMPVGQLDGGHILYSLLGYRKHKLVARSTFAVIVSLAGLEAIPMIHESLQAWIPNLLPLSLAIWGIGLYLILRKSYQQDSQWIGRVWSVSLLATVLLLWFGWSPAASGSMIWLFWSAFLAWFIGLEHPPAIQERPLTPVRRWLGWTSMVIFVLCISPNPISFM